ncbi:IS3 family transposase, partial [Escherichia coli]
ITYWNQKRIKLSLITYWNQKRIKLSLGGLSPVEYRTEYQKAG